MTNIQITEPQVVVLVDDRHTKPNFQITEPQVVVLVDEQDIGILVGAPGGISEDILMDAFDSHIAEQNPHSQYLMREDADLRYYRQGEEIEDSAISNEIARKDDVTAAIADSIAAYDADVDGVIDVASVPVYRRTFSQVDLTIANLLPVHHNLGVLNPTSIAFFDSLGNRIYPDDVTAITANSLQVSFVSYVPLIGIYSLSIAP